MRQRPVALSHPPSIATKKTEEAIRRVAAGVLHREITRNRDLDEARRRVDLRDRAARKAREDFSTFWKELMDFVNSAAELDIEIGTHSRDDTWILALGCRRIVIWAGY